MRCGRGRELASPIPRSCDLSPHAERHARRCVGIREGRIRGGEWGRGSRGPEGREGTGERKGGGMAGEGRAEVEVRGSQVEAAQARLGCEGWAALGQCGLCDECEYNTSFMQALLTVADPSPIRSSLQRLLDAALLPPIAPLSPPMQSCHHHPTHSSLPVPRFQLVSAPSRSLLLPPALLPCRLTALPPALAPR